MPAALPPSLSSPTGVGDQRGQVSFHRTGQAESRFYEKNRERAPKALISGTFSDDAALLSRTKFCEKKIFLILKILLLKTCVSLVPELFPLH